MSQRHFGPVGNDREGLAPPPQSLPSNWEVSVYKGELLRAFSSGRSSGRLLGLYQHTGAVAQICSTSATDDSLGDKHCLAHLGEWYATSKTSSSSSSTGSISLFLITSDTVRTSEFDLCFFFKIFENKSYPQQATAAIGDQDVPLTILRGSSPFFSRSQCGTVPRQPDLGVQAAALPLAPAQAGRARQWSKEVLSRLCLEAELLRANVAFKGTPVKWGPGKEFVDIGNAVRLELPADFPWSKPYVVAIDIRPGSCGSKYCCTSEWNESTPLFVVAQAIMSGHCKLETQY